MSIVDDNILNKWKPYKHNMIKYNAQSNIYNKSIQTNYNNSLNFSYTTDIIINTSRIVKNPSVLHISEDIFKTKNIEFKYLINNLN